MKMPYLALINKTDEDHLESVKEKMLKRGSPTLRCYYDGESYCLLEGSHRAMAANQLGIKIKLKCLNENDVIRHDIQDLPKRTKVLKIWEYMGGYVTSPYIRVEDDMLIID
jgi:hypothetical protein